MKRWLRRAGGVIGVAAAVVLVGCAGGRESGPPVDALANDVAVDWLHNPQGWADQTWEAKASADWVAGERQGVAIESEALRLGEDAAARFPSVGVWVSPTVEPALAFTELLPSWNVSAEPQTGLGMEVRVRQDDEWSPWLRIGEWGRVENWRGGPTSFAQGRVEIDVLRLKRAADAFQVKVVMQSHDTDPRVSPSLRKLFVVTSTRNAVAEPGSTAEPDALGSALWQRDLAVPFFTQQDNPPALRPRTCSPTSTSMVMAYRGVERSITENALGIYDHEYAIFGNWGRAVAWASQHGLSARLVRLRSWSQVEDYIRQGQPIIASIKFASGTFPSNVMDQTDGHLIVIRGLTAEGDAIVNDPASRDRGDGVVYKKDELAAAWFGNGGVGYIIGEPAGEASASTGR